MDPTLAHTIRRDDFPPPPADCPVCGLAYDSVLVYCQRGTLWTAAYVDPMGHVWETRWAADVDNAA